MFGTEKTLASRIVPPNPHWQQDLVLRDAPPQAKADSWDELNHLDESYLEFSLSLIHI